MIRFIDNKMYAIRTDICGMLEDVYIIDNNYMLSNKQEGSRTDLLELAMCFIAIANKEQQVTTEELKAIQEKVSITYDNSEASPEF
jgi:hypothetical protein